MPNTSDNSISGGFSFTPVTRNAAGNLGGGFQFDLPLAAIQSFNNQALSFASNNSNLNRDFVGGIIGTAQANVTSGQNRAMDLSENIVSRSEDVARNAIKLGILGRACYITTAICEKDGLPDDCEILQTFRAFRDGYVAAHPSGPDLVREYYADAPDMLRLLDADVARNQVLEQLRDDYLMPAYHCIKRGENAAALAIYITMVASLKHYVGFNHGC